MRAGAALALGVCASMAGTDALARAHRPHACTEVRAAFTPGDDIAQLIAVRIGRARASVQVQAYLFTDGRLARALVAALERGVRVEVIGDAAQFASGGLPWLATLERAGAKVYLNAAVAAAHNKIVIVDGESPAATVITGSYNYTHAAQERNAENVVVLSGNPALAGRFLANFRAARDQSTPWR